MERHATLPKSCSEQAKPKAPRHHGGRRERLSGPAQELVRSRKQPLTARMDDLPCQRPVMLQWTFRMLLMINDLFKCKYSFIHSTARHRESSILNAKGHRVRNPPSRKAPTGSFCNWILWALTGPGAAVLSGLRHGRYALNDPAGAITSRPAGANPRTRPVFLSWNRPLESRGGS